MEISEADFVVAELAEGLKVSQVQAAIWKARALALGWGQESPEDPADLDKSADR